MEPFTFDSRDIGQTEEFLSKAYAKMRTVRPGCGPRAGRPDRAVTEVAPCRP